MVEIRRDGIDRYWIVDVDYSIVDSLKQVREIGCIQIDIENAKRLDIKYFDKYGNKKYPVIIHSAIPGGIERYIYMLLDNFKESFPLWLCPIQVRFLSVNKSHSEYLVKFISELENMNLRFEIDDREESIGKKIRKCHDDLIPSYFVFGDKEVKDNSKILKALLDLSKKVKGYPYIKNMWPMLMSKQVR